MGQPVSLCICGETFINDLDLSTHMLRAPKLDGQEHYKIALIDDETREVITLGRSPQQRRIRKEQQEKRKARKRAEKAAEAAAVDSVSVDDEGDDAAPPTTLAASKGAGKRKSTQNVKIVETVVVSPPAGDRKPEGKAKSLSPTMMSRSLTLPTILNDYYDFVRSRGWEGVFSDFVATIMLEYFHEHGFRSTIVQYVDKPDGGNGAKSDSDNIDALADLLTEKVAGRLVKRFDLANGGS